MYVVEVRCVYRVFTHLLHVRVDFPGVDNHLAPVRMVCRRFRNDLRFPAWCFLVGVVPNEDLLIHLAHVPSAKNRLTFRDAWRHILSVWDVGTLALTIPAPAVEGALDAITYNTWPFAGLLADPIT